MAHILRAENVVGVWTVPVLGVRRNAPIISIPDNALYDANNVLPRNGFLVRRPGMEDFVNVTLTGRPTGMYTFASVATGAFQSSGFQNSAFQMSGNLGNSNLVVGTTRKIYAYFGGTLNDVTGTTLTAMDGQLARFTSIFISAEGISYVLHVNGADAPRKWNASDATFVAVGGSPPSTFTDVATISDHVVGIIPPYTIRWCNNQDIGTWPAANILTVGDTPDPAIAIRTMGIHGGVLYKRESIWAVIPSLAGGTESTFFRKDFRGSYEGPAGTSAVVDANGIHLWMTETGRVGAFDGASVRWVADGVWPLVKAAINTSYLDRVFGKYIKDENEVWFYYPRTEDTDGQCRGIVMVKLPDPDNGIPDFCAFPGSTTLNITAGSKVRKADAGTSALVATSDGKVKKLDDDLENDDATAITGFWQTGLIGGPGLNEMVLESFETFAVRGAIASHPGSPTFGNLSVQPVASMNLDTEGGTLGTAKTLNLDTTSVNEPRSNANLYGRFWGMRMAFTSAATIKWIGSRLAANARKG